jgi:hypothetical protein
MSNGLGMVQIRLALTLCLFGLLIFGDVGKSEPYYQSLIVSRYELAVKLGMKYGFVTALKRHLKHLLLELYLTNPSSSDCRP